MSHYIDSRSASYSLDASDAVPKSEQMNISDAIKHGPARLQDILNKRAVLHAMVEKAARVMDSAQRNEAEAFECVKQAESAMYQRAAAASHNAVIEFRNAFNIYRRFLAAPTENAHTLIKFRQLEELEERVRVAEARARDNFALDSHEMLVSDNRALHTAKLSLDAFFRINSVSAKKGQQEEHQANEQGWDARMQRLSLGVSQLGPETFSKYLTREADDVEAKIRRMSIADIAIRRAVAIHMLKTAGIANPVRLVELAQLSALGATHVPKEPNEIAVDKAPDQKEQPKASDDLLDFVKVLSQVHVPAGGDTEMHHALSVGEGNEDIPAGQLRELDELREKMLDAVWDELREGDRHGHARLHAQEAGRHGLPMDSKLASYKHLAEAYKLGTYLPAAEEQAGETVPRLFQIYREMLPELAATRPTAAASVLVQALRGQQQLADLVQTSTMKMR